MKFLAILRDSLRETLDVKLFYVMIGLSLLVVLLVSSITYKPVPMERQVKFFLDILNVQVQSRLRSQRETQDLNLTFDLEDFKRLDDRSEPWLGSYNFILTATVTQEEKETAAAVDKHAKQRKEEFLAELKREVTAQRLEQDFKQLFVDVQVRSVPSQNPDQLRFQFTTDKGSRVKSRHEWYHEPALFFGLVNIPVPLFTLGQQVEFIGDKIIGTWGAAFTMLLSTIITASFLPNMLGKGSVDLLLAKPIHRVTLFVYKFLGGLLFMLLNTVVIMVGVWLGIGLQSGLWIHTFLLCIPIFTFQFAIFYAVSALIAVLTRSAIVAILASMATWALLVLVGWAHWIFIENNRDKKPESTTHHWAYVGFDVVKAVLPRYKDIDWLTSKMIKTELIRGRPGPAELGEGASEEARERRQKVVEEIQQRQIKELEKDYGAYNWTSSLTVSSIFIVVMLALACWWFTTKDY